MGPRWATWHLFKSASKYYAQSNPRFMFPCIDLESKFLTSSKCAHRSLNKNEAMCYLSWNDGYDWLQLWGAVCACVCVSGWRGSCGLDLVWLKNALTSRLSFSIQPAPHAKSQSTFSLKILFFFSVCLSVSPLLLVVNQDESAHQTVTDHPLLERYLSNPPHKWSTAQPAFKYTIMVV